MKPPKIVSHSFDASCCRYICIPANNSTENVVESKNDSPLETAVTKDKMYIYNKQQLEYQSTATACIRKLLVHNYLQN